MSTTFTPAATIAGAWCALTLWRQRQQRDVRAARRLLGRHVLEAQRAAARQRRVYGPQRLTDVVDRDDTDQLDVGMDEQAPDELRAAVPGAADDDGLEALHLVDCKPGARPGARYEPRSC
jgi:hypothetical protein